MKMLYEFSVRTNKSVKVKVENEDGSVTIRNEDKEVPIRIGIKKPNRLEREDGDMEYSKRLSECIRSGLLTKAQLTKEYSELGGVWSDVELKRYEELHRKYQKEGQIFGQLQIRYSANPTKENKEALADQYYIVMDCYHQLRDFEELKSEVFNETAENKARARALSWYLCKLSYYYDEETDEEGNESGEWRPLLKGETVNDQLDDYDEILENYDFNNSDDILEWRKIALDKAMLFVSLWYAGKINNENDLALVEELLESDPNKTLDDLYELPETSTIEEKPIEEAKPAKKKTVKKKVAKKSD